jgi:FKBP-type peptidyl-prolyl cis-trans isomerase FkpA
MKKFTRNTLAVVTSFSLFISAHSLANNEPTTDLQKESYSIGASVGNYISNQIFSQTQMGAEVDVDMVVQGAIDALKGQQKFTDEEVLTYLNKRAEFLNAVRTAEIEKIAQKSMADGQAYLETNKSNSDVVVTKSGLQYQVLKQGEGRIPNPEDVVTVNYKGFLVDGTQFDDSYERGEPNRFALISVIAGWQEGITLMPEGSIYKFAIPAALAYGNDTVGMIPPSSTLVFEVELVKVEEPGENAHGMGLSGRGMGGMMGGKGSPH